jgi:hypothetical protein
MLCVVGYGYDDEDEYFSSDGEDSDEEGHHSFPGGGGGGMFPGMSAPHHGHHHHHHGASYFSHVGGTGNRLGDSSSDTPATSATSAATHDATATTSSSSVVNVMADEEKREKEKEARLKRFATAPSVSASTSPHQKAPAPRPQAKAAKPPLPSPSFRFLSPEEQDMEVERVARATELERLRRDKAERVKERKRLQIELEHDRKERKKNCGVLPGSHDSLFSSRAEAAALVSDVTSSRSSRSSGRGSGGGCDVAEAQSLSLEKVAMEESCDSPVSAAQEKVLATTRKVDSLLDMICKPFEQQQAAAQSAPPSITTAAEVDVALSLLLKIFGNIIDNPQVEKFRSINTTGKMYKDKLARVLGVQRLLYALGFKKQQHGGGESSAGSLQLRGDAGTSTSLSSDDLCIIIETRDKVLSIVECRKLVLASLT